mgnify:CR=1 FL=1|tara:strand:+ start:2254 stop:2721 length:468 start_codon:yes stop_codon:yes gene_type:complete
MKIIFKIFILVSIICLNNCTGYEPIFNTKNNNFSIIKITTEGQSKINYKIKNRLSLYQNLNDQKKFYSLEINSESKKTVLSKDSKGDPNLLSKQIVIQLRVLENEELIEKKSFLKNFSYKNNADKFNLKQYEKNIEDNLINDIVEEIVTYLQSLK